MLSGSSYGQQLGQYLSDSSQSYKTAWPGQVSSYYTDGSRQSCGALVVALGVTTMTVQQLDHVDFATDWPTMRVHINSFGLSDSEQELECTLLQ